MTLNKFTQKVQLNVLWLTMHDVHQAHAILDT